MSTPDRRYYTEEEIKNRTRTQVQHMADRGELVDWVMGHFPRKLEHVHNAFRDELQKIARNLSVKHGDGICCVCGQVIPEEKDDDGPRFSQPESEIPAWVKE